MDYLNSFIVGSSLPIFGPFYMAVLAIPERTFSAVKYPITASLYFGAMNAGSLFIQQWLGLSYMARYITILIISVLFVSVWITMRGAYKFKTRKRWYAQYGLLLLGHGLAYALAIGLESTFMC